MSLNPCHQVKFVTPSLNKASFAQIMTFLPYRGEARWLRDGCADTFFCQHKTHQRDVNLM